LCSHYLGIFSNTSYWQ